MRLGQWLTDKKIMEFLTEREQFVLERIKMTEMPTKQDAQFLIDLVGKLRQELSFKDAQIEHLLERIQVTETSRWD